MGCILNREFGKSAGMYDYCKDCAQLDDCILSTCAQLTYKRKKERERKQERLNQNRQTNNMKQTEYSELLKHPKWQKKRLEILEKDKFKCQLCKDEETTLHVHHKKYKPNLKPWEYDSEDLITLCEDCHFIIGEHEHTKDPIYIEHCQIMKIKGGEPPHLLFFIIEKSNTLRIYKKIDQNCYLAVRLNKGTASTLSKFIDQNIKNKSIADYV